jgi:hypothetical protein
MLTYHWRINDLALIGLLLLGGACPGFQRSSAAHDDGGSRDAQDGGGQDEVVRPSPIDTATGDPSSRMDATREETQPGPSADGPAVSNDVPVRDAPAPDRAVPDLAPGCSPGVCGPGCQCPRVENATVSCTNSRCEFACNNGFHRCGDTCARDSEPATCGTRCSPCEIPMGGSAACNAGQCQKSCPPDRKLCGDACIAANAACNGQCPAGERACAGICRDNRSTDFCGSSCEKCPVPAGSMATCDGTACAYVCRPEFLECSNRVCGRRNWQFDAGSLDGAYIEPPGGSAKGPLMVAQGPPFQGQRSGALAVQVAVTPGSAQAVDIRFPVCPGGRTFDLRGKRIRLRVFLDGPLAPNNFTHGIYSDKSTESLGNTVINPGSWSWMEGQFGWLAPNDDPQVREITVSVNFQVDSVTGSWSGTVYLDELTVE